MIARTHYYLAPRNLELALAKSLALARGAALARLDSSTQLATNARGLKRYGRVAAAPVPSETWFRARHAAGGMSVQRLKARVNALASP